MPIYRVKIKRKKYDLGKVHQNAPSKSCFAQIPGIVPAERIQHLWLQDVNRLTALSLLNLCQCVVVLATFDSKHRIYTLTRYFVTPSCMIATASNQMPLHVIRTFRSKVISTSILTLKSLYFILFVLNQFQTTIITFPVIYIKHFKYYIFYRPFPENKMFNITVLVKY